MPSTYEVGIQSLEEVHSLPGIWSNEALRELLVLADMDDIGQVEDSELLEITIMALQDLGNQKAAELVLEAVFGESMRAGVRQNLVDDLQQDEPWEDFAEVSKQRGLFIAVVLLEKAFPNRYATPDALLMRFVIRAVSRNASEEMKASDPAWMMRLLAYGMSGDDVLNRLYEAELASGPFADAAGIIWYFEALADEEGDESQPAIAGKRFVIIAPHMWLDPLKKGQVFRANAN
ncbi:MAG: hypothetical protein HKO64_11195 [Xanthomonadales bacterium]|nr:hypothetical protein [Xanthomonadales bacterium]NNL96177.1 hypothetical protein [Xanthomonadales bacterium]